MAQFYATVEAIPDCDLRRANGHSDGDLDEQKRSMPAGHYCAVKTISGGSHFRVFAPRLEHDA
jgi:hypothetical protein